MPLSWPLPRRTLHDSEKAEVPEPRPFRVLPLAGPRGARWQRPPARGRGADPSLARRARDAPAQPSTGFEPGRGPERGGAGGPAVPGPGGGGPWGAKRNFGPSTSMAIRPPFPSSVEDTSCPAARRAGTSETEPSRPLDKAESTSFYSCRFDASRMRVSCQLCTASSEWKILCTLSIILRRRAVLTAGLDVATRTAMSTYLPRPQNRYRGCVSWAKGRYEGGGVALVRVPSNKANALSEAHVVIKAQDTA